MFGSYDDDGELLADVDVCVLTGQAIEAGDAMIRLNNTPYFVRVKADQVKNVTPGVLEALRSQLPEPYGELPEAQEDAGEYLFGEEQGEN